MVDHTRVTVFTILLAAFKTLLYRYTEQTDIVIGVLAAGRSRLEFETLMGYFLHTLVLRTKLSGDLTFQELLQREQQVILEGRMHENVPFIKLVEAINPERQSNQNALFQIAFNLEPLFADGELCWDVQQSEVHNGTAKLDLYMSLHENSEGISGFIEYRTDLFKPETISRMIGHFQTLLERVVAHPTQSLSSIPIMLSTEQQTLSDWNKTERTYPKDKNIVQLFEAQVKNTPNNVALVFEDQQLTYQQLNQQANQLARYIRRHYQHITKKSLQPDTLIGLCVERSLEMLVGLMGILKAGAAYVPIDPAYPKDRIHLMLEDTKAQFVLTQSSLKSVHALGKSFSVTCIDINNFELFANESTTNLKVLAKPQDLVYVIYTSGSTGQPKGVMIEHRGLVNCVFALNQVLKLNKYSKATQFASLSFDAAIWEIFSTLTKGGGTLHVLSSKVKQDITQLVNYIQEKNIDTITFLPPAILENIPLFPTNGLNTILIAGDECPPGVVNKWGDKVCLINAYGPTEATICTNLSICESNKLSSIGKPISNVKNYILDKQLNPVPVGVVGELHIGGVGLARGYLNQPKLTQEKFIPNPFAAEADKKKGKNLLLYKTGDLVRWLPDGNVEFIGRKDFQVKLRGFRIELGEIENALCQHTAIEEVLVIDRENALEEKCLVAYVKPVKNACRDAQALRRYLQKKLPEFMVPSGFVFLDVFPLTENGKVDRHAMQKLDWIPLTTSEFVAPSNPTENRLTAIWMEFFQVEKIGIRDNFFDLGGHSLSVVQMIAAIHKAFNVTLPANVLFDYPSIEEIAPVIGELKHSGAFKSRKKLNFQDEIQLDDNIRPNGASINLGHQQPQHIFLTGASGYLGAFLLHELLHTTHATVFCLIRSPSPIKAQQKLQQVLKKYLLWDERFTDRIHTILGDLEQPLLGMTPDQFQWLAAHTDVIYHCGSQVSFIKSYYTLKAANVLGTQEVLRLAVTLKTKPVYHISTPGVFSFISYFHPEIKVYREDDDLKMSTECLNLDIGYIQSKWVAEQLVWEAKSRGIPIAVFRPGFILCSKDTGITNLSQFWPQIIKSCIQVGSYPELIAQKEEFVTVDYVVKAIVHLTGKQESIGKCFHLVPNPEDNINTLEFFQLLCSYGYSLKKLPYDEWVEDLINYTRNECNIALYGLLPGVIHHAM